jgi:FPC/CPF motif-containing protein YcgG
VQQQALLTRAEVECRIARGHLPEWAGHVFADFCQSLSARERPFPCTFGIDAFRNDGLRYVFADDPRDERSLHVVRDNLTHFLGIARTIHKYTSLVVFFRPLAEPWTIDEYRSTFWATLAYFHAHDPQPWPADVPTDPDHPDWEFCFAGQPTFVVCNTPAHVQRVSRRSAGLIVTFQPRWVFDDLRANPLKAKRATAVIRARLEKFDTVPISSALGTYGDPNNREWKQYFLPDVESHGALLESPARCPFEIIREPAPEESAGYAHT